MADHPLLKVVEDAGERERRALLDAAEARARETLEEARERARRIQGREPPPPSAVPSDPRLARARTELLDAFVATVSAVRAAAIRRVRSLPEATRHRIVSAVLGDLLAGLEPGTYRLAATQDLWAALTGAEGLPPGRGLRRAEPEDADAVLRAEGGSLCVRVDLESMVARYFEVEPARVVRLVMGDEPL